MVYSVLTVPCKHRMISLSVCAGLPSTVVLLKQLQVCNVTTCTAILIVERSLHEPILDYVLCYRQMLLPTEEA